MIRYILLLIGIVAAGVGTGLLVSTPRLIPVEDVEFKWPNQRNYIGYNLDSRYVTLLQTAVDSIKIKDQIYEIVVPLSSSIYVNRVDTGDYFYPFSEYQVGSQIFSEWGDTGGVRTPPEYCGSVSVVLPFTNTTLELQRSIVAIYCK